MLFRWPKRQLSRCRTSETMGAGSVRGAVHDLQADRIGHGVRAIEDADLLNLLHERQIVLEINPTSNVCLHVYRRLAEHPFPHLDKMGLLVTVNSDDPPLFNTTLCQEYAVLATEFGYTPCNVHHICAECLCGQRCATSFKKTTPGRFSNRWVETQKVTPDENAGTALKQAGLVAILLGFTLWLWFTVG